MYTKSFGKKMAKKYFGFIIVFSIMIINFSGCASLPKQYTKGVFKKPTKIVINMPSDPAALREDWRMAFENEGYEVYFMDEINVKTVVYKSQNIDIKKDNIIEDKDIKYEFRLSYVYSWDAVYYVAKISLGVRDMSSGKIIGSYRDKNIFAHPSVETVVANIQKDFLSKLWKE